jgi:hypothetical protein
MLPEEWCSYTLQRLRHKLFLLPAQLARPQNRPVLRLNRASELPRLSRHILMRINRLQPLR